VPVQTRFGDVRVAVPIVAVGGPTVAASSTAFRSSVKLAPTRWSTAPVVDQRHRVRDGAAGRDGVVATTAAFEMVHPEIRRGRGATRYTRPVGEVITLVSRLSPWNGSFTVAL
jgi:hypothetical protein